MRTVAVLILLPVLALSMPLSISGISSIFSRQTAALETATDEVLFGASLGNFIISRNAKIPAGLDWASDGCSYSPDNPFGFNFLPACYRHDFGYRNYKIQSRFSDASKAKIDRNFRADMYNNCASEGWRRNDCENLADLYYLAVREFGKREAEEKMERAARQ